MYLFVMAPSDTLVWLASVKPKDKVFTLISNQSNCGTASCNHEIVQLK